MSHLTSEDVTNEWAKHSSEFPAETHIVCIYGFSVAIFHFKWKVTGFIFSEGYVSLHWL